MSGVGAVMANLCQLPIKDGGGCIVFVLMWVFPCHSCFVKAVGSKAKEIPFTLQFLFNFYVQRFIETETLFIKKKVREILFEGYYEPMMAEIQYILGEEKLKDNKFGLYYPVSCFVLSVCLPTWI